MNNYGVVKKTSFTMSYLWISGANKKRWQLRKYSLFKSLPSLLRFRKKIKLWKFLFHKLKNAKKREVLFWLDLQLIMALLSIANMTFKEQAKRRIKIQRNSLNKRFKKNQPSLKKSKVSKVRELPLREKRSLKIMYYMMKRKMKINRNQTKIFLIKIKIKKNTVNQNQRTELGHQVKSMHHQAVVKN